MKRRIGSVQFLTLVAALSAAGLSANAQQPAECRTRTTGPDVIVGDLIDMNYYGRVGDYHAFAVGTTSCNVGTQNIQWVASNNLHPVIGQNMYRVKNGRFEQVGLSWLKHGFTALTQSLCSTCSGQGGAVLGVGCSDPYTAGLNGSQGNLGPRWQVNPATGVFAYPPAGPSFSGDISRRLQVLDSDLVPAQNVGAQYFVEGQYVTQDDAATGNSWNNVSYRKVNLTYTNPTTIAYAFAGPTQCTRPAIFAWRDHGLGNNIPDPGVTLVSVDVPGDGRFWIGCKVTDNGDGSWHYEYAIQNITSDRCAGAVRFPVPVGSVVENLGFHDCPYHSGDGIPSNPAQPNTTSRNFASTDWSGAATLGQVRWATETYASNTNANALRWGTVYNFRFDANAQPNIGTATIELWKPGATSEVSIPNIPVPSEFVPRNVRVLLDTITIPDLIPPTVATTIKATILAGDDQVQAGSAQLFYRHSNNPATPFIALPMSPTGVVNEYQAQVPGTNCGTFVSFYVQAAGQNSGTVTAPLSGALAPIVRPVGTITSAFEDNFSTDKNWSGTSPGDTATAGRWVRGAPIGTSFNPNGTLVQVQPATDHTADPETNCWFTGQGVGGGTVTAADVDNGITTLTTPVVDLSTALTAKVSYWRWFVSGVGTQAHEDNLVVQISNNNGTSWAPLETVPGSDGVGGWVRVLLPVTLPLTSQMKVRFIASDTGAEQVVEAAIDDFYFETTACDSTPACAADWNGQGGVTLQDLFDFIGAYFSGNGDFNNDGGTTVQDVLDFVDAWFTGC